MDSQQTGSFKLTYEKRAGYIWNRPWQRATGPSEKLSGWMWAVKEILPGKQLGESEAISAASGTNRPAGRDRHRGTARIRKCCAGEHLWANDLFTSINITVTARVFYVRKPSRRYPAGGSQENLQRDPIHLSSPRGSPSPPMGTGPRDRSEPSAVLHASLGAHSPAMGPAHGQNRGVF